MVIGLIIMPLAALAACLIAAAAFRHWRWSERQARIFAWLVTLGLWELGIGVASTCGQLAPASIGAVLSYSAGILIVLSLFAGHAKASDPIEGSHESDETWP